MNGQNGEPRRGGMLRIGDKRADRRGARWNVLKERGRLRWWDGRINRYAARERESKCWNGKSKAVMEENTEGKLESSRCWCKRCFEG